MSKRSQQTSLEGEDKKKQKNDLPKGFKQLNNERKSIVCKDYHVFALNRVPVSKTWFKNLGKDDDEENKITVYVSLDALNQEDVDVLQSVDASLNEKAGAMNPERKHCALINDDEDTLKLVVYLKLTARKKDAIMNGQYHLSGSFMLSSVYDYEGYYGINLIVPKGDKWKKPVIVEMKKPKVKPEQVDDEEDKE